MNVGSFLYRGEVVIFPIKGLKIILFDEELSSGQHFLGVSGDVVGDILKYNGSKHRNPIFLLTSICQCTPCQIPYMCDNLCNFSELLYTFA